MLHPRTAEYTCDPEQRDRADGEDEDPPPRIVGDERGADYGEEHDEAVHDVGDRCVSEPTAHASRPLPLVGRPPS
jgi:hypothetical protein